MKFLASHVQASAPVEDPKSAIPHMIRVLGAARPARGFSRIHASEITKADFCPRFVSFVDENPSLLKPEVVGPAMRATFDLGEAVSDLVRNRWMGDRAVGNWKCLKCGKVKTFSTKPKMSFCSSGCLWQYEECKFESLNFGVSGSIDVMFNPGEGHLIKVYELKIIRQEDFEKLLAPLPEHRIRTSLYLRLISESNSVFKSSINLIEASVLYVSRAHGKANPAYNNLILPFKEFNVVRDDTLTTEPLSKALEIKVRRAGGPRPSRICGSPDDKIAKRCAACSICFKTL